MRKTFASISLDLDDKWTYLKTHGDDQWKEYPSYLDYAIPRILDFLDKKGIPITFFIVAQDAKFDHNKEVLREIANRGHDIGNHTFHHDPWLHLYSEEDIHKELEIAENHISQATGVKPKGFRGPGFSFSPRVIKVLAERGYVYDATTFPNILNPLARAFFLSTSKLSKEEKEQRKGLFGSWKDGFRSIRPYQWKINNMQLLEIPVTTMPLFKVPIHTSYILYLSSFSPLLGISYFRFVIFLLKLFRIQPSILLHPLDFIGHDDTTALSFFPAMNMESQKKLKVMSKVMDLLKKHYHPVTMAKHAQSILDDGNVKTSELPLKSA